MQMKAFTQYNDRIQNYKPKIRLFSLLVLASRKRDTKYPL